MSRAQFIVNGEQVNHSASLGAVFGSLWSHRGLWWQLVRRDVAGRYRGSLFGSIWAFLNPLLMLTLYTVVFGVFLKTRWAGADNSLQFSVVLFAGLIVFNLFAECLNRAPALITQHVNYVKKVAFPLELLPWMVVGTALFHAGVSLLVWLCFSTWVYGVVHWTMVFVPLVVAPLLLMVVGLVWLISSLGVYVRDIGQFIGVVTAFVMFMCPIFYPLESLPPLFQSLMTANPLTFIIQQMRLVMIAGQMPDFGGLALYTLCAVAFAWLAFAWFQRAREGFADVL